MAQESMNIALPDNMKEFVLEQVMQADTARPANMCES